MTKNFDDIDETSIDYVADRIDQEGMDYTFRLYSDFADVEDEEFHRLRVAYVAAAEALENYVEQNADPEFLQWLKTPGWSDENCENPRCDVND